MAEAEKLEQDAEKAKDKADKPLPALVSPTVNLVIEIRQAIALRCRETGESFSIVTNKMWLSMLKQEKRVKADLAPDFSVKRGGGGGAAAKEREAAKDKVIAELQKELATLKAAKK